jgi:Kelch motif
MLPQIRLTLFFGLLLLAFVIHACDDKDEVVQPPAPLKTMPVARAGNDFRIYLPMERQLSLSGSGSYDPDGAGYRMTYTWTKLSGPEVLEFRTDNSTANMTILETGTYSFELKVVDVQSNIAKDTVEVTAIWGLGCDPNVIYEKSNYEPVASLTELVPADVSVGTGGNNIVFAGGRQDQDDGWGGSDVFDSLIYVYNAASNTTIKSALSLARAGIGIALAGNEVFLAGGIISNSVTDVIDIFNLNTRVVKKAKLSVARSSVKTVVAGHLVFFAGGRDRNNESLDIVDIYDLNSGKWSVAKLSLPRADVAAIASGTKVVFAGGDLSFNSRSSRIDIYDLNSGQWSTAELPASRSAISSAVLGDEIVLDGGFNYSANLRVDQVDFLNPATMAIRSVCMLGRESHGGEFGQNINTVVIGNKLYYLGSKVISRSIQGDSKWSMTFPTPQLDLFALFASGGQLYGVFRTQSPYEGYLTKIDIFKVVF